MFGLSVFQSLGSATACRFDRLATLHVVASDGEIQEMAWQLKGKVANCDHREYGFAQICVNKIGNGADVLFEGLGDEFEVSENVGAVESCIGSHLKFLQVWMSHGDQLSEIPADFHVIGHTPTAPFASIAHNDKPWYGIQFHPEVTHSPRGREVIGKFVLDICLCSTRWTMVSDGVS